MEVWSAYEIEPHRHFLKEALPGIAASRDFDTPKNASRRKPPHTTCAERGCIVSNHPDRPLQVFADTRSGARWWAPAGGARAPLTALGVKKQRGRFSAGGVAVSCGYLAVSNICRVLKGVNIDTNMLKQPVIIDCYQSLRVISWRHPRYSVWRICDDHGKIWYPPTYFSIWMFACRAGSGLFPSGFDGTWKCHSMCWAFRLNARGNDTWQRE